MLDMLKFLKSRDVLCKLVTMNLALVSNAFLCPAEAMRTATATTNINSMAESNRYVFLDDSRYSPKRMTPQNVLTSGNAWKTKC